MLNITQARLKSTRAQPDRVRKATAGAVVIYPSTDLQSTKVLPNSVILNGQRVLLVLQSQLAGMVQALVIGEALNGPSAAGHHGLLGLQAKASSKCGMRIGPLPLPVLVERLRAKPGGSPGAPSTPARLPKPGGMSGSPGASRTPPRLPKPGGMSGSPGASRTPPRLPRPGGMSGSPRASKTPASPQMAEPCMSTSCVVTVHLYIAPHRVFFVMVKMQNKLYLGCLILGLVEQSVFQQQELLKAEVTREAGTALNAYPLA
ncbi:MAG: hypothetical protein FRX49_09916 [Trebouxia sp. A1-2]|nr:MAG: hypothetical protein FRX49_09916 [Trebouxia sp. A1-2]